MGNRTSANFTRENLNQDNLFLACNMAEEKRIVEKLLRSLPSIFDVIVTTIEETKDLTKFSVDELHASLMTHEQRLGRSEN